MCYIESSSFVAAGFGTTLSQVAGFHRAVPSTTLDKASMQFVYILLERRDLSIVYPIKKWKCLQMDSRHPTTKLV